MGLSITPTVDGVPPGPWSQRRVRQMPEREQRRLASRGTPCQWGCRRHHLGGWKGFTLIGGIDVEKSTLIQGVQMAGV